MYTVALFTIILMVVSTAIGDGNHARIHRDLSKRISESAPPILDLTEAKEHQNNLTKRAQFNNARWTFFDVGLYVTSSV
jgi:hypothetical protein